MVLGEEFWAKQISLSLGGWNKFFLILNVFRTPSKMSGVHRLTDAQCCTVMQ